MPSRQEDRSKLVDGHTSTASDQEPCSSSLDSVQNDHDQAFRLGQEKAQYQTDNGRKEACAEAVQIKHTNVNDASSIPDGGLWAWLQVLGGFFLLFNSW